ncbi:MAG: hypothetical protein RLN81_03880 [Balneolaceae bacterium]
MNKLIPFFLVILFFGSPVFAQNYLAENESFLTEFENGQPDEVDIDFENLSELEIENVHGLADKRYTITNAQISTITISQENLGRLVLYAKLFNKKDSVLFNPISTRSGIIEILLFRGDSVLEDKTRIYDFSEDIFQQIHLNTLRAGIDKVKIRFRVNKESELFIIEKLKIVPYNSEGVSYYSELEKQEEEILDITSSMTDEANSVKENFTLQISRVEAAYSNLKTLTSGKQFESVATIRVNSFNPFKSSLFSQHYEDLLFQTRQNENEDLQEMISEFDNNEINIAMSLDQLFLGGRFTSLFMSLDNFFKNDFVIEKDKKEVEIVNIKGNYFISKKARFGNKLKLSPLSENDPIIKTINELESKNEAYKNYVSTLAFFLKEDIETSNELDEELALARKYIKDYEKIVWEITEKYAEYDKSYYFDNDDRINFAKVTTAIERNFIPENITAIDDLKKIRSESIRIINKMEELSSEYESVTSKIKTYYDLIYKFRPESRKEAFTDLALLPNGIKSQWRINQESITLKYAEPNGVQSLISKATGKESSSND